MQVPPSPDRQGSTAQQHCRQARRAIGVTTRPPPPTSGPRTFWTAYFWHGYMYASSGGSLSGLYILGDDDITDAEPSAYNEGMSWGRWTDK